jgi:hypothetical protein
MLGFSLSKILFTAVMIMAVWWVYRQINRLTGGETRPKARVDKARKAAENVAAARAASADGVEDLTACPTCGAYVAAGLNPGCGRAAKDCPMQR